jgi:hypothetical protein
MERLISYASSTATAEQINSEISEVLRKATTDARLKSQFEALGLNAGTLEGEEPVLEAKPRGPGFEPVSGGILVVFGARFGYKVASDLWSRIFLPQLELRFGTGVLKGSEPPAE